MVRIGSYDIVLFWSFLILAHHDFAPRLLLPMRAELGHIGCCLNKIAHRAD